MTQKQSVGQGAQAYQAGSNIVVYNGITPEQLSQILAEMASKLMSLSSDASRLVEERLEKFRQEVLELFAQESRANAEAFGDPDFLYLVRDTQEAYVRSGDDVLRDTLLDIIARRSKEQGRTRRALALNLAATRAQFLTKNEFAELSLAYLCKYTLHRITNFPALIEMIKNYLMPFLPDISEENASYWHLESQSCASIQIVQRPLRDLFVHHYGGLIGQGITRSELEAHVSKATLNALEPFLCPSLHDNNKIQPAALNKDVFLDISKDVNLPESEIVSVWSLFESSIGDESALRALLRPHVSNIDRLFDLWNSTLLCRLDLTSLGITIAHANAVRVTNLNAPLSEWIK